MSRSYKQLFWSKLATDETGITITGSASLDNVVRPVVDSLDRLERLKKIFRGRHAQRGAHWEAHIS